MHAVLRTRFVTTVVRERYSEERQSVDRRRYVELVVDAARCQRRQIPRQPDVDTVPTGSGC